MKHYFKIITILLSLLFVFSVSFLVFAEPTDNQTSQPTENTEQTESDASDTSSDNNTSSDTSSDNASSDNASSDNASSDGTTSEKPSVDDTPIRDPAVPEYVYNEKLLLGTKEQGIILPENLKIYDVPLQNGLQNYNFTDGLKFWASINAKKPADAVMVMIDGENSFLMPNQLESGDGIISAPFFCENIIPGQAVVIIYDWSGSADFKITLEQYDSSGASVVSSGFGKSLYEAKNDQEWNTSVTKPIHPIRLSDDGYNAILFNVKIEIYNPTFDLKIDNLRIGYSNANGIIYDINGNEIKGEARTSNQAEAPLVEFKPPITDERNNTDQALERGGDNENLINIFIVLCTIALCIILSLLPSAIVKAVKKRKMAENLNQKEILKEKGD